MAKPWQVSLQVRTSSREALLDQRQFTVAAEKAATKEQAIAVAKRFAELAGHTVVDVVGAYRGY